MPLDGVAYLANAERDAKLVMARVLEPPPPVDYGRWARENLVFGAESPFPGPYDPTLFPYFARILQVLGPEDPARVVALAKSAQLGGTVVAQIFLGASLDLDPGPFLYTHPTEGNATRWAKTKWRVMIRNTSSLARLFGAAVTRDTGNSTLYQERKDGLGFVQVGGANSAASLSMLSVPKQVQDDLSKWETNSAGDPETQADSRSKAFDWAKNFKISTPLIAPGCRITNAFRLGSQEHWHVPCPHCEAGHPLEWRNFVVDEADPAASHFVCPSCGGVIEQHHRRAMVAAGRWVAHNSNPLPGHVSFHLWAAYSPLESWTNLAVAWIQAKGDPHKEQAFFNDWLGLAYEVQGESPPWEAIRDRAEAANRRRGIVPEGALLLTLSMDCQDDRVEWHLVGWGRSLRRWVVEYGVVEGHIGEVETQARLDALLAREWPASVGRRRVADLAGIDGNAWTNDVYDWVRRHPQSKVIMVRGINQDSAPPLALVRKERGRDGKLKRYAKRFFNVGVSALKLGLYRFLSKEDPLELGYVDMPAGMGDDYFEQLCSERRVGQKRKDGTTEYRWVLPPGTRNEALDTMVYGEALAIRLGWRQKTDQQWDALEADLEAPAPAGEQLDLEDVLAGAPPVRAEKALPATMPKAAGSRFGRGRAQIGKRP